ncbi:MAG: MMPL family transporter [Acidobacteriota bacterium]|nr:MMPL family transporter [Acidobacteriota bacterium]
MKLVLTNFGIQRPWVVLILTVLLTAGLGLQMPKVNFDNDPENMLSEDEPVRVFHHQVKEKYSLYDFVIVGIVNESHADGIFNTETLGRIGDLTEQLLTLQRTEDGKPAVTLAGSKQVLDLSPDSTWKQVLNFAFRHNPNRLFDEEGGSAIIAREIISPSVVDNIKQAELGSLRIAYLMEEKPTTREEALEIRDDAMSNPLYAGTLVAEDQKAICLYLPIQDKTYSYNVAELVRTLTADWEGDDEVYITGLPVAEDTFGVEMLVQMATSAPMAGVAIFLLLLFFFRRISLIVAPMLVALVSVITTMGLLIGLGFDVHIMSSMIAIFLMPIAVADAVHILSEFYDTYPRFKDKAATVRHVVGHLFSPMLYTTLTTMVGFASLAATPIPPVRVFGLHVAFGVGMAWLLTMVFIPAYLMLFVPSSALTGLAKKEAAAQQGGRLQRFLEGLGSFSYRHAKAILAVTMVVLVVAAYGISLIRVNDNPVKWFTPDHPVRVADKVLNEHFGGTYTAYLTFSPDDSGQAESASQWLRSRVEADDVTADIREAVLAALNAEESEGGAAGDKLFTLIARRLEDQGTGEEWARLADEVNYLDPAGLTRANLQQRLAAAPKARVDELVQLLGDTQLTGEELLNRALEISEAASAGPADQVLEWAADFSAPLFKQPAMLRWVEDLQKALAADPVVGKTSSAVDALKKASYELQYQDLPEADNQKHFSVPDTVAATGQVFTQLEGMKKKDSLFHLVTRDYREANLWIQLKSGDNRDMEAVVASVDDYMKNNPPPAAVKTGWAGLTYINVVWQEKMVKGMLSALGSSFLFVLVMMIILFRSPVFGIMAMIPLSVTISFIYGLIGLVGKEYDMPVAVLSALTLGLSVDFAIHFLQRSRELQKKHGSWKEAITQMFKEPAVAISRNAITISIGFTPLLAAPLVPYKTVGFFLATIMAVSWMATLFILAALATVLRKKIFAGEV